MRILLGAPFITIMGALFCALLGVLFSAFLGAVLHDLKCSHKCSLDALLGALLCAPLSALPGACSLRCSLASNKFSRYNVYIYLFGHPFLWHSSPHSTLLFTTPHNTSFSSHQPTLTSRLPGPSSQHSIISQTLPSLIHSSHTRIIVMNRPDPEFFQTDLQRRFNVDTWFLILRYGDAQSSLTARLASVASYH